MMEANTRISHYEILSAIGNLSPDADNEYFSDGLTDDENK